MLFLNYCSFSAAPSIHGLPFIDEYLCTWICSMGWNFSVNKLRNKQNHAITRWTSKSSRSWRCAFFFISYLPVIILVRRSFLLEGTFQHFLWLATLLIQLILDQSVYQGLVTILSVALGPQVEHCQVLRCQNKGSKRLCFMVTRDPQD